MCSIFNFLFRRETVLVAFLLFKVAATVFHGVTMNTTEAWGIGIMALMTYSVIALFAWKRHAISIWAISIIILYDAAGSVAGAWDSLSTSPVAGVVGMALGVYLILGGLAVFSSRRESA